MLCGWIAVDVGIKIFRVEFSNIRRPTSPVGPFVFEVRNRFEFLQRDPLTA
jgi:hypothetical protein